MFSRLINKLRVAYRTNNEILWSNIYNSTIADSAWLLDKSISPGRWAVGYPFLYALYRCLNDYKPQSILELGLGQSTRVTAQYAASFQAQHIICEHDADWLEFFQTNLHLSSYSSIKLLPLGQEQYRDTSYYCYENFADTFAHDQYNLILVDGPFGNTKSYARRDLIKVLPGILAKDFAIIFDDYHCPGEYNTVLEIQQILQDHHISFVKNAFDGSKRICILASESWRYLCSI